MSVVVNVGRLPAAPELVTIFRSKYQVDAHPLLLYTRSRFIRLLNSIFFCSSFRFFGQRHVKLNTFTFNSLTMAGMGGMGGLGGMGGMGSMSNAQQQQEQMRIMEFMQEMQVADSLRMYNELVQRCFSHCVDTFRSRKLDGKEVGFCVSFFLFVSCIS